VEGAARGLLSVLVDRRRDLLVEGLGHQTHLIAHPRCRRLVEGAVVIEALTAAPGARQLAVEVLHEAEVAGAGVAIIERGEHPVGHRAEQRGLLCVERRQRRRARAAGVGARSVAEQTAEGQGSARGRAAGEQLSP
jgi:hypothetical protein